MKSFLRLIFCGFLLVFVVGEQHEVMPAAQYEGLEHIGTIITSPDEDEGDGKPSGRTTTGTGLGYDSFNGLDIKTDYYMSSEKASWTTARRTCPEHTDGLGHLLQINTEAEDLAVNDFVRAQEPNNKVGEYIWTDGSSDHRRRWTWNSNGAPMKYENFKIAPVSPAQYASFIAASDQTYWWSASSPREKEQYYICETGPADVPATCYIDTDLMIVMDISGSIGSAEDPPFKLEKDFAAKLALAFRSPSRVGFIVFNDVATTRVPVNSGLAPEQVADNIRNSPAPSGGTRTDRAIRAAMDELRNARKGALKKMVVITDGMSNEPVSTTAAAADAKAASIYSYSVGVGATDANELLRIAGGVASRKFSVANFDYLKNEMRRVSLNVCRKGAF